MHCPACSATLPDSANFCVQCGAPSPAICGACGFANPARANYCAHCGAKLAGARGPSAASTTRDPHDDDWNAASVDRRQLTVLFCDLVASTALASRLDPEDLRHVIGAYHRCVADTVERFGGFVARYMGDGALVYFGYPRAYEDNAERAVRAALALVTGISVLDAFGEPLRPRIGISTGLVVVGELVNAGAAREQMALGETPNLAARLQAMAEPNAIVIAATTRRLLGDLFKCEDLGDLTLSGFASPMRAWRVMAEERSKKPFKAYDSAHPRHAESPGLALVPLIGRAQESALLRDCWKHAREGHGRVMLVVGDAGIGKSRLVQAFAGSLAGEPHAYLEFGCSAYHDNSPLYPVIALLPAVLEWHSEDSHETRLDKLEAFCVRHRLTTAEGIPLLAALLSLPASTRFPAPSMSPELQRQRTLQILTMIVLSFAAEKPLMIVVEDVHWIDPTSKQLLTALIDQVPTVPLFLLLTARPDFEPPWSRRSYLMSLALNRFAEPEVEEMARRFAGERTLPAEMVDEIVRRADGVPLFVEELVKAVIESRQLPAGQGDAIAEPPPPLAIPPTLQDLLAARLNRLAGVKPVAQLCATLGREFPYTLLKAVSTIDEDTLEGALARLVGEEFLHQRGASSERVYVFKHAMIQEAAYESLLRSTRQHYHRQIAAVLAGEPEGATPLHPEIVAFHYTQAGDVESGVGWWQKAAQRARGRASYTEAIAHCSCGLRALESLPDEQRRGQLELALRVDLGYSLIPLRGWGAPETAEAFSRAGELGRQIGDTPGQVRALWGIGAFHFVRGDQHKAREAAEKCLDLARQVNDKDALIVAHYLMGIVLCARGDFLAGCVELRASVDLYGDAPREMHRILYGQDTKASALGWLGMALWATGQPDEALARAYEALDFVRDTTQPFLLARGLASVGFVRVFRREPQATEAELPSALALCVEQHFTYFRAVVSTFHGANLVLLGKTAEGIELIAASMQSLRRMGSELLATPILAHLASAQLALGRVEEASTAIDEGLACVERNGERWAEAELLRLRGQVLGATGAPPGEAEACFRNAIAIAHAQRAKSYELRCVTSLASYLLDRSRADEARELLAHTLRQWSPATESADLRDAREVLAKLGGR